MRIATNGAPTDSEVAPSLGDTSKSLHNELPPGCEDMFVSDYVLEEELLDADRYANPEEWEHNQSNWPSPD